MLLALACMMDYKVVVVGDSLVGKSCIINAFVRKTFISDSAYMPTIIDYYRRNVMYEGENYLLDIADTAGDNLYMPVTEDEIRKGVCFLCVFALDDLDSFEKTGFFIEKIRTVNPNNPPIVLIGNKSDKDRVVEKAHCEDQARRYKVLYLETSANHGKNIDLAFLLLIESFRYSKDLQLHKERKSCQCCIVC